MKKILHKTEATVARLLLHALKTLPPQQRQHWAA